jgi:hypothetical protein
MSGNLALPIGSTSVYVDPRPHDVEAPGDDKDLYGEVVEEGIVSTVFNSAPFEDATTNRSMWKRRMIVGSCSGGTSIGRCPRFGTKVLVNLVN